MSIEIDVLITGAAGPEAIDRVKTVIHRALREEIGMTEWHLTMKHRTAEHEGTAGGNGMTMILRANNVK